jgi:hypothetical protein
MPGKLASDMVLAMAVSDNRSVVKILITQSVAECLVVVVLSEEKMMHLLPHVFQVHQLSAKPTHARDPRVYIHPFLFTFLYTLLLVGEDPYRIET